MKIIRQKQFGQIWDKVKVGATLGLVTGAIPGSIIIKRSKDVRGMGAGLGTAIGGMAIGAGAGLYKGLKDKRKFEKSREVWEQMKKTMNNSDINNIIKLRKALWKYDDIEGLSFYEYLKKKNLRFFNTANNMDSSLGIEFFDLDIPEIDFHQDYEASPENLESLLFDEGRLWDFLDIKIRLGDDIHKYNSWAYNVQEKTFELYNWCHQSFSGNAQLIKSCRSFSEFKNFIIRDLQGVAKTPTISDKDSWENTSEYYESVTKDQFMNIRKDLRKYIQQYISEITNIIQKL